MDNLKPKEPLVAVMLSVVFTGLGQIYAGRVKRGLAFLLIQIVFSVAAISYILNPATRLNFYLLIPVVFFIIFDIFVIVDAYQCAGIFNLNNKIQYKITFLRKTLYIAIILVVIFVFNPSQIIMGPIALYIRANISQAFKIPSSTMEPALEVGDRVLVDKMIYKKSDPKRGDIIVFKYPEDTRKYFVKRLIGLPGETLGIKDGKILINGSILQEPHVIAGIFYYNKGDYGAVGKAVKISPDSYYVLGDNSDSSRDSRYWGFVPKEYLIGKAYKIYFPLDRFGPVE